MWALLSRRLRLWLLFSVVIPLVRRLWSSAKANRMARKARAQAATDPTPSQSSL